MTFLDNVAVVWRMKQFTVCWGLLMSFSSLRAVAQRGGIHTPDVGGGITMVKLCSTCLKM